MGIMEEWRDIEEFKGVYMVSDMGRVKSIERHINTRTYPSQIMKTFIGNNNSVMVHLRFDGKQVRRSVAKLVVLTFIGKPPQDAKQVKHIDGDPNNNKLENLKWDVCKGYYAPVNSKARELYFSEVEKIISIFINEYHIRDLIRFDNCYDIDDFKQQCLWWIWKYIDTYPDGMNFYTFCATLCKDIVKRYWVKRKKEVQTINFEGMVTDKRPLDYIPALTYREVFCDE